MVAVSTETWSSGGRLVRLGREVANMRAVWWRRRWNWEWREGERGVCCWEQVVREVSVTAGARLRVDWNRS